MKVDFHSHTVYSIHANIRPRFVARLGEKKGLSAVLVCDHDSVKGGLIAKNYETKSCKVIVGSEIKSGDGEIIGFNIKEDVPKGLSGVETIGRIHELGGFAIIPHPYDAVNHFFLFGALGLGRKCVRSEEVLRRADFIEVANSRNVFSFESKKATLVCQRMRKPFSAGSDAHTFFRFPFYYNEFGNSYVELSDVGPNPDDIISELGKKKCGVFTRRNLLQPACFVFNPVNSLKLKLGMEL